MGIWEVSGRAVVALVARVLHSSAMERLRFGAICLVAAAGAGCGSAPPRPPLLPISVTSNYVAGALAREADDHTAAATAFAAAAREAPAPFPLIEQALATQRAGNAAAGLALARTGLPRFAASADLWLALGQLSAAAHRPSDEVQQAFARARSLAPNDQRAYLMAARFHPEAAAQLQLVRALLQRQPRSLDGNMAYAELLGATALDADTPAQRAALATLERALRVALDVEPNQLDARLSLATAMVARDDLDHALVEVRSAFSRSGDDLDIGILLMRLLAQADRRSEASDTLHVLVDERPVDALEAVASAALDLGLVADAMHIVEVIAVTDRARATRLQALAHMRRGDTQAALEALVPRMADVDDQAARILAAEAWLQQGQPERTAALLNTANTVDELVLRARAEAAQGHATSATIAKLASLLEEAAQWRVVVLQAQCALDRNDAAAAVQVLAPSIASLADVALAQQVWAQALAATTQRLGEALLASRRAMRLAPGDGTNIATYGYVLLQRNQPRAAVRALDLAHRLNPADAEIALHLAQALAADGAPRSAATLAAAAARLPASARVQTQIRAFQALRSPKQ